MRYPLLRLIPYRGALGGTTPGHGTFRLLTGFWRIATTIGRYPKARAMINIVAAVLIGLAALLGECGLASAQDKVDGKTTQELKQVDPVPPATGKTLPEQAGTQEPSTKGKGHDSSTAVFVNGMLAVPGTATDAQTAPAKYSARNAEIDKLPTVAFRLRGLADAQKREIYEQLHGGGPGGLALSPAHAMLGAEIPSDIALRDLKPTPESLTTRFPELRGSGYLLEGPHVLLVGSNNVVIGVLSAP